MKQLHLFSSHSDEHVTNSSRKPSLWMLFVDGASRNNPGPSAAGIYLLKDSVPVYKEGFFLGKKTNNQAEYFALVLGLFAVSQRMQSGDMVKIVSDSQLLVRQVTGQYKVKKPHLQQLCRVAQDKIKEMDATISHVMREENTQADKMANHGVDSKNKISPDLIELLNRYEIKL